MEAHTPKRYAVERYLKQQSDHGKGWQVRVVDEQESPVVRLEAMRTGESAGDSRKTLEIHTRQITLTHEELDESTKKMIIRWLDSLSSGQRTSAGHEYPRR